jgi:hypothetical protein
MIRLTISTEATCVTKRAAPTTSRRRVADAQLDAADLARDGLGQLGELEAADALVRLQVLARSMKARIERAVSLVGSCPARA